jgi:hypothetical protein
VAAIKPCPNCGSVVRNYLGTFRATISVKARAILKARDPSVKKRHGYFREQVSGASYTISEQDWGERTYVVDRQTGTYFEEVEFPNGEVWRKEGALGDQAQHGPIKLVGKRIR